MRVSDKNIDTAIKRVVTPTALLLLTTEELKNLCFAYCCVLQNEEEIRPVLESLRGIVA